jgi:pyruvate/2-oxoglutarate dehydrogenase complex dihydrolipoamide dehydrogenase (E3) component
MVKTKYIIIGSGETGIRLAQELVKTGEKVILVEQDTFGGTYMHSLDYPKYLLNKDSQEFAVGLKIFKSNLETFSVLRKHRQKIGHKISEESSKHSNRELAALEKYKNFKYLVGKAEFFSKSMVEINSSQERHLVSFEQCALAVGKNVMEKPTIKGLDKVAFLFQHSAFLFAQIPSKLAIIGCTKENLEVASIYSSLGVKISIFEANPATKSLPELDRSLFNYLLKSLNLRQVEFFFDTQIKEVKKSGKSLLLVDSSREEYKFSHIYINIEETFEDDGLNLKKALLTSKKTGVVAAKDGKTTQKNIFAFGECNPAIVEGKKLSTLLNYTQNEINKKSSRSISILDLTKLLLDKDSTALDLDILKIDNYETVVNLGFSEQTGVKNFGTSVKSFLIETPDKNGFLKAIYKESQGQIIGFALAGDFAKEFEAYAISFLKKGLNLKQLRSYLASYLGVV